MSAAVLTEDQYCHIQAGLTATAMGRAFLAEHETRCQMVAAKDVLARLDELKGCITMGGSSGGGGDSESHAHLTILRRELQDMGAAITQARREIAALKPESGKENRILAATEELDAIVTATERATSEILNAAEAMSGLSDQLSSAGRQDLASQLLDHVTTIFTACSFQDITGQRTTKVVHTLRYIEQRINSMMSIWNGGQVQIEGDMPPLRIDNRPDAHLLNGPALPADHKSQDDIDALFSGAADPAPSAPAGQDDIDAMFAAPAPSPAAPLPSAPAGQDDIDALFAAPAPEPAPAPVASVPAGQDDIDALFAAPAPVPAAPEAAAPEPAASAGQDEINALFDPPPAPAATDELAVDEPAPYAPDVAPVDPACSNPLSAESAATPADPVVAADLPEPTAHEDSALFDPIEAAPPPAEAAAPDTAADDARLAALDLLFPADSVAQSGQPYAAAPLPHAEPLPILSIAPTPHPAMGPAPAPADAPHVGSPARALADRLSAVIGSVADPARPNPVAESPQPAGARISHGIDPAAMNFAGTVPDFLATAVPQPEAEPVAVKKTRPAADPSSAVG